MAPQTVSKWERGILAPDVSLIPRIAMLYHTSTDELLGMIDVLVDGEFVLEKKNLMLKFRGSENQRLIDLKETLKTGKITTLPENT